ncbi:cell division protein ZapA [Pseudogracilibacillus auburnensis]|uniref:Cell division protein ZapA n=1 Tax=Pseudogracilibacillus auburnensis TaxID=1494959 RepID=A0A2V3VLM2_9BACI|nr:cell division protein ZapA [Pseudogracilibacillus auburnensis]MBO1002710.1 cell division protein ZapA [Pseudogracilibacillus auburnensis]PXW81678.1 cell division protein ZapA [Pseudogracilibacillus auburnensis]
MAENKERTKISVKINKRTYTIVGTESKDHVELVAKLVNNKMDEIYQANKHLDTTKLAVLTAINTMNDYLKLKEEYEELLTLLEEEN